MTNALLWVLLVLVSLMFLVMLLAVGVFIWWIFNGGDQ